MAQKSDNNTYDKDWTVGPLSLEVLSRTASFVSHCPHKVLISLIWGKNGLALYQEMVWTISLIAGVRRGLYKIDVLIWILCKVQNLLVEESNGPVYGFEPSCSSGTVSDDGCLDVWFEV